MVPFLSTTGPSSAAIFGTEGLGGAILTPETTDDSRRRDRSFQTIDTAMMRARREISATVISCSMGPSYMYRNLEGEEIHVPSQGDIPCRTELANIDGISDLTGGPAFCRRSFANPITATEHGSTLVGLMETLGMMGTSRSTPHIV